MNIKLIIVFTLGVFATELTQAQDGGRCTEIRQIPVRSVVLVNGKKQQKAISKNDLLKHGLSMVFYDDAIKFKSLVLSYDCQSSDISERIYYSKEIAPDIFLKGVQKGSLLVFDCIIGTRGKEIVQIPPFMLEVIE